MGTPADSWKSMAKSEFIVRGQVGGCGMWSGPPRDKGYRLTIIPRRHSREKKKRTRRHAMGK